MTVRRKGVAYTPELEFLLRDAEPLTSELTRPDGTKAPEVERRRDIARDILFAMYRDAKAANAVHNLDPRIRQFCEEMKRANGGRLPRRIGGRPEDLNLRLCIWLRVNDAIADGLGKVKACEKVAAELKPPRTWKHVRDIWWDRSPSWMRLTSACLAERRAGTKTTHPLPRTAEKN